MFTLGSLVFTGTLTAEPTPSQVLLVTSKDPRALEIVDPRTMKVVAIVPLDQTLHEVTASDDGKFAFVSGNHGGVPNSTGTPGKDYISIIDLVAQKEVRR